MKNNAETKIALKRNIKDLIRIESDSNLIEDPDFGVLKTDIGWKEEDFVAYVRKKNTSIYICQISNSIIGYIAFSKESDTLTIDKLVIDPVLRKNGFGSTLLNFVENLNFSKIIAYVRENDDESILFFKNRGFIARLQKNHYGSSTDAIVFERNKNEEKKCKPTKRKTR